MQAADGDLAVELQNTSGTRCVDFLSFSFFSFFVISTDGRETLSKNLSLYKKKESN